MDEYSDEEEDEMCDECGVYQSEMKEPWNHYGICPACEKEEDNQ